MISVQAEAETETDSFPFDSNICHTVIFSSHICLSVRFMLRAKLIYFSFISSVATEHQQPIQQVLVSDQYSVPSSLVTPETHRWNSSCSPMPSWVSPCLRLWVCSVLWWLSCCCSPSKRLVALLNRFSCNCVRYVCVCAGAASFKLKGEGKRAPIQLQQRQRESNLEKMKKQQTTNINVRFSIINDKNNDW